MDPDWVTGYMSDLRFLQQLWCATLSIVLARAERIGIWLLHGSAVWAAVPSPSLNDRGRASAAWWLVTSSASNEGYPKVRNHGEVESGYNCFHI